MLLHAVVHPADIQDRDGGILLLATLVGMYPFLQKLFVAGGYQGLEFQKALAKILPHLETETVVSLRCAEWLSVHKVAMQHYTFRKLVVHECSRGNNQP